MDKAIIKIVLRTFFHESAAAKRFIDNPNKKMFFQIMDNYQLNHQFCYSWFLFKTNLYCSYSKHAQMFVPK